MLTAFANDSVRAYNKFLLAQVFRAAAPENVRKLLSHKDQTRMTVDDAYDTFFTDHRVENDKKERAMVNVIDDEQDSGNATTEQDIAVFRPQQRQQQQRYGQQQNSNYRSNQNQQQKGKLTKIPIQRNNTTAIHKAILAMANFVHTARSLTTHKKSAEKE